MYIWRKHAKSAWLAEHGDKLIARFGSATAITERPGKARTLVEVSCRSKAQALDLQREAGGAIEKLRADWLERFAKRSQVKPLRIGSRQIVIPAEAAFGTGEHATTAMCLRMLQRVTENRDHGWTMLDAGTGSGILAIAGSCLGAATVVAIDNDPIACSIAQRNAPKNGVRNLEVQTGDILKTEARRKIRHHHRKPLQRDPDRGPADLVSNFGARRLADLIGSFTVAGTGSCTRSATKSVRAARDPPPGKMDRRPRLARRRKMI